MLGSLMMDRVGREVVDMLGSLMMDRVGREVDSTDVVTIDHSGAAKRMMKLLHELAQPAGFSNTIHHSSIFRLSTGPRHSRLTLGRPGDEIVPEKHAITRGRLACVRTSHPISICVDNKISQCGLVEVETEIQSTVKIAKNPLHSTKMRLPRVMHI
jgi:hypothetical protein